MSDAIEDLDLDNDSAGPKALRDALKAEKKARAELEARLATFEAGQRETAVKNVLRDAGANEKLAALYTGDKSDEASIKVWLDQYADVFGIEVKQETAPNAAAAQQVQQVLSQAPAGNPGSPEDIVARYKNASEADLIAAGLLDPVDSV